MLISAAGQCPQSEPALCRFLCLEPPLMLDVFVSHRRLMRGVHL